jgi:hypothetical protein
LRPRSAPRWPILGVLAEFADEPEGYADAKSRKNYSGRILTSGRQ